MHDMCDSCLDKSMAEIEDPNPSTVLCGIDWTEAGTPPMAQEADPDLEWDTGTQSEPVLAWAPGLYPEFTVAFYSHASKAWYCCERGREIRVSHWRYVRAPEST